MLNCPDYLEVLCGSAISMAGWGAAESGIAVPERPSVFTKFPSCITGPYGAN